jgi:hypothetical protein
MYMTIPRRRTLRGVALPALCWIVGAHVAVAQSVGKPSRAPKKAPARSAAPDSQPLVAASNSVMLRDAPEGRAVASFVAGAPMTAIARDRGWVRVRVDGWVHQDSVQSSSTGTKGSLSAADLRVDPQGAKGKTVRWDVQVLALENADFLHRDLSPDEPYLLARGPGSENMLLYVAVPQSMLASARALAAAAPVSATLVATVRVGRSEPVGVPVLDAQSIARH